MHIPVLKHEILHYLNPKPNQNFIDCTFGMGGHSQSILEKNGTNGKVLGIEADKELFEKAKQENQSKRLILVNSSYINLKQIVKKHNFKPVHGILFDLGMSSWHLDKSNRGFSFQKNEPLDMRFQTSGTSLSAQEIVNQWLEKEISEILQEFGEEQFSQRIAQAIVEYRKKELITNTFQLVEIIKQAIPKKFQRAKIHPATKTFQALRIAVNNELENLDQVLPQAVELLEKNGKIAVISFHSLEDRIVKHFFKDQAKKGIIEIIFKKPIIPGQEEIKHNFRSRSAKLRAGQKV